MQLQEAHRHRQLNGQESQGLQTRLSRCFFLTRDRDRWKFQLSTIVRISGSSVSLRKNSLVQHNGYKTRQWVFGLIHHLKTKLRVLNIVDAASEMHIAIQIADQTAETIWRAFATGWLRWAGSPRCLRVDPHRSQIARGFFDKAEGRDIFVESAPAEAHWQMGQVENNARYLRQMGYRIVEDIDVSQSDFQTMLDELTDAKNSLVQHNGYMPRQWVFALISRVPGHMLEENSDLPNLDPEGRFRRIAEMRHKCRMAAIRQEMGQVENNDRYLRQMGEFQTMSDELSCAKEQLRTVALAERDDPDERSKHGVPRQQDLTQQQPPTESPPQNNMCHHSPRRNN